MEGDYELYAGKIHFAIAIHSIECWLLPFWGRNNERGKVLTCKQRVDSGLSRNGEAGLRKDLVETYRKASRGFRKRSDIARAAQAQESLSLFLQKMGKCFDS